MATYATTKILKKAQPAVRISDNIVKSWDIEVLYTYTRPDNTTWSRSYPHTEDVEYLNKLPSAFTKSELIGFMPPNMDVIFDAHYDAHNTPPTEQKISDFNLNSLT
jgi:hypothetical protein